MSRDDDDSLCPYCAGSGEGMCDDTICHYCKGRGVSASESEFTAEEDRAEFMREMD